MVDTNILLVANGKSSCSKACELECAKKLLAIKESGCVVLDYGYEILREYANKQTASGQPGIGFLFWKWLLDTKRYSGHCDWVAITRREPHGYEEFPEHSGLRDFDPSDMKFVAVSMAHSARPPILQAADSKWWGWNSALKECGVIVEFLCPKEIEANFVKKMGNLQ